VLVAWISILNSYQLNIKQAIHLLIDTFLRILSLFFIEFEFKIKKKVKYFYCYIFYIDFFFNFFTSNLI